MTFHDETLADYQTAGALLSLYRQSLPKADPVNAWTDPVGARWLAHAEAHLLRRLDEALRLRERPVVGVGDRDDPSDRRAALAIVKGVAEALGAAADALEHAAQVLKDRAEIPYEASLAHVAAKAAREVQQSLIGQ